MGKYLRLRDSKFILPSPLFVWCTPNAFISVNKIMETPIGIVCPSCNASSPSSANYCPGCGRRLRPIIPSTSASKQIVIYLISFFLAPFGLLYAWKYLKQGNRKSKTIAYVAIALTAISIVITVWTMAALFNSLRQLFNLLTGFILWFKSIGQGRWHDHFQKAIFDGCGDACSLSHCCAIWLVLGSNRPQSRFENGRRSIDSHGA